MGPLRVKYVCVTCNLLPIKCNGARRYRNSLRLRLSWHSPRRVRGFAMQTAGPRRAAAAVGAWEGGGPPRRCGEPSDVPHQSHVKEWLHKTQDEGHPAFEGPQVNQQRPDRPSSAHTLSLKGCQRLVYATVKSNTSHRTELFEVIRGLLFDYFRAAWRGLKRKRALHGRARLVRSVSPSAIGRHK